MQDEIEAQLRGAIGDAGVLSGPDVQGRSAGIWGPPRSIRAVILARPDDTEGVARVLRICSARRQPVVVHGGLTGVVDGAWAEAGEVVLSLERLTGVESVDPLGCTMVVRAGTTLQAVQEAADDHGLMFPLDLGARGTATIGGNAATNAGGNRVLRYGMIRSMILGLEAVLPDGTVVSSLNQMLKNNAGYDLKQLFIGTEGTLGVITRLVLRLVPRPATRSTALVAIRDFESVCRTLAVVGQALAGQLSAYEVMWPDYYAFIDRGLTATNPGRIAPLVAENRYYVLIEALGSDPAQDADRFETVLDAALRDGLLEDAVIAQSEREQAALWAIRDDVAQILEMRPNFLFDVSLPMADTPAYVAEIRARLTEAWPDHRLLVFGHLGDGNIHLGISAGEPDGSDRPGVEEIVYAPLSGFGGSVSAEHGIGLEKKPYLSWCRSDAEIALMRKLKRTLDPQGILNPGKVFDES
ncbi:MAG: FAD-binding oxidoreductase [Gammaproteobacteria bacterium]|nr:FAD-binding oxidoreductase [Gammaproteobacteria bacterium]